MRSLLEPGLKRLALLVLAASPWLAHAALPSPVEARAIAREATVYGFPMVDSYRVQYTYFVDRQNPEYKAPWNTLKNVARVFTPEDKTIQTPNSDTPFSFLGADLRAEPLVISVPAVEKGRYYSAQFVDMYTFDFAYVGTRATGNGAGNFLLAGPRWNGPVPPGIKQVLRAETDFAFVQFRTQLKAPSDLGNVEKVQAGYKVQPLSAFLGRTPPAPAARIDFPRPLGAGERTSLEFFNLLGFLLHYAPAHPAEAGLRARLARLGLEAEGFDVNRLPADVRDALRQGMADAWSDYETFKARKVDTGILTAADVFGTREYLDGNYMGRMAGAVLGIYGNPKEETLYRTYYLDAGARKLDGANRYRLRFPPGQLPPANAFWSVTLYDMPANLLVANPIDRYLINSPMLPGLQRDADGGLTLYIQHGSPGKEREANWLPAPRGPFQVTLRMYLPKPQALDGSWKRPPLQRMD